MNREAKNATITLSKLGIKNSKNLKKQSRENLKNKAKNASPKGTLENPYKYIMKLKGREFVKDAGGKWHEVDENGNLIPDEEVKPL